MRHIPPREELRIYAAEGKQLVLRYQPASLPSSDRDCDCLEMAIDVSAYGIGPYRNHHVPVAVLLDRHDCEALLQQLQATDEGQGRAHEKRSAVFISTRPSISRIQPDVKYTELSFEGIVLWREYRLPHFRDHRLHVCLHPIQLGRLVAALSDLLLPPDQRHIALPSPRAPAIAIDPTEYIHGC